jgi:dienelactone hydrolase
MKKEIGKFLVPAGRFAATCAFSLALILTLPALAQADGPAQEVFLPKSQKGPVVVLISGQSGTSNYRFYGRDVAALGYYTVLIDGKDILTRQQDGAQNLRKVIARAQTAPEATPGKVAVVGFSQGGSGVLLHAVTMPELISAAIAYYPGTDWTKNLDAVAARIQIPLLVLAGERDRYKNCCVIESIRELEAAAKAKQIPLELIVYPYAGHGFNLSGSGYRGTDADDAWRRTSEMLARYLPVK